MALAPKTPPHAHGPGSYPSPGGATFGDGSPVTGVNLLRAIKRELLAQATPAAPELPEAGSGLGLDQQPDPAPGAGVGASPIPPAKSGPGSRSGVSGPTVVRQGRHRRVLSDDKRLKANGGRGGTRQRRLTDPPVVPGTAETKAKLKALAKKNGLSVLPGSGTLTLATRKILGGRDSVLQYIRIAAADGDLHAETFLHVWDDLKVHEQKVSTLDDVCAAAGVLPVKLVKAIVGCAFEAGCDIANLVAATAHPDVVASTVKFAKGPLGGEDRKMLLQHAGFLPTPKGTTINVGVTATANAMAAAAASSDSSVPSFLEDMDDLTEPVEAVQSQLIAAAHPALPPATVDPMVLDPVPDAELVD